VLGKFLPKDLNALGDFALLFSNKRLYIISHSLNQLNKGLNMPNSIIEQLQRDAKKQGAFQAKIAYAQYLLKTKKVDEAKGILQSFFLLDHVPVKYQAEAHLAFAQCLEQEAADSVSTDKESIKRNAITAYENVVRLLSNVSEETVTHILYPALTALATLYGDTNVIKSESFQRRADRLEKPTSSVQVTARQTPEFRYKVLRHRYHFQKDPILPLEEYQQALISLLKDPELTDTLKAKILFQNIAIYLMKAERHGELKDLVSAELSCRKLSLAPELNNLPKAERLDIHKIEQILKNNIALIAAKESTDGLGMTWQKVINVAQTLLKTGCFNKTKDDYGTMQDRDSMRPIGISFFGKAEQSNASEARAYLRALSSPSNIRVTARALEGKEHCVELPAQATVSDFTKVFNRVVRAKAEKARLFTHDVKILEDKAEHTLETYGITEGSVIIEMPGATPKR
jgi:hypothetical protein